MAVDNKQNVFVYLADGKLKAEATLGGVFFEAADLSPSQIQDLERCEEINLSCSESSE